MSSGAYCVSNRYYKARVNCLSRKIFHLYKHKRITDYMDELFDDQYNFTQWPSNALDVRYEKLIELLPLVLSHDRREIMGREMAHIIFELQSRELESGIAI